MLERMWGPTLGIGKMAGLAKHKKQKVQLFEVQTRFKFLVSGPVKSSNGSVKLSGTTCDPCMTYDPCMEWCRVWGYTLLTYVRG